MVWMELVANLGMQDAIAFNKTISRTGGLVFPDHLVGMLADMRHPVGGFQEDWEGGDDDDDDYLPEDEDHALYETLAYVYVQGKAKGWKL